MNGITKIVFTFPGQGAYHFSILRELHTSFPETRVYFRQADRIARQFLQHDFLPLITASSQEEHDLLLRTCPDLDQLGIYLAEISIANLLMRAGLNPDLLVGHSLGELAALSVAGAYSINTGFKIVCQRILALQDYGSSGGMAAVSCDSGRAKEILDEAGKTSIAISVINHPKQTVLSGTISDLEKVGLLMGEHGICLTLLKSRYPYHSHFLKEAVKPFRISLAAHDFRSPTFPVFLCTEGRLYSAGTDLTETLSSHFVRKLDFQNIVDALYSSGCRTFIECGAGEIVTKLVSENLKHFEDITCLSSAPLGTGPKAGLENILHLMAEQAVVDPVAIPLAQEELPSQRAQQLMSTMLNNLSLLVQNMSTLVENTTALMQMATRTGLDAVFEGVPDAGHLTASTQNLSALARKKSAYYVEPVSQSSPSLADGSGLHVNASSMREQFESGGMTACGGETQPEPIEDAAQKDGQEHSYPAEDCREMPIAIVSLGCVLPAAFSPEEYWENIKNGVSGIIDLAQTDPESAQDFLAGSAAGDIKIVADKTYTLLNGTIGNIAYNAALLSEVYSEEEFNQLTRGQRLLAIALAQCLSRLKCPGPINKTSNIQCILGATADGSNEYDEARFLDSLYFIVEELDEPQSLRESFTRVLEGALGPVIGDSGRLTQHAIYRDVTLRMLSASCRTYVIDSACSSSLYSINLGIKALTTFDSDMVMAGGVFAPGPANNTLFAQFRGLTSKQSRPLDEAADGVVFGDGAAVVALKRLSDALAHGDRVLGVIRGMGLSSDGKSPSVNVPQASGQSLAMRKVYEGAHIDVNTIQYIEAHATATAVGDAVEFSALKEVMQKRDPSLPPIEVGSVKALIGHTGWVSGVASVVKICKMFEEKLIPKQYNYRASSKKFGIEGSAFTISTQSRPWPRNVLSLPRRAGINGFGFGGTNAHIVLEEFDETYHRSLCARLAIDNPRSSSVAVVGVGSLFPAADKLDTDYPTDRPGPSELRFRRDFLRLPAKKLLLPDIREHMDASQYLAALAAEKIFASMPDRWHGFKDEIAVVLGLESKTDRGVRANERIYLDRLRRLVLKRIQSPDMERILNKLCDRIRRRSPASGAYTLPGLMPNVTASRIAHLFDLKGPNVVVDMGGNSLFQALLIAKHFVMHDDCKMALAGGINAESEHGKADAEAAVMLALTTEETARREGLPILAMLSTSLANSVSGEDGEAIRIDCSLNYKGAQGGADILRAISQAAKQAHSFHIDEQGEYLTPARRFGFSPAPGGDERVDLELLPSIAGNALKVKLATDTYVQKTAIYCYTPLSVETPATGQATILTQRRILFLTDQPQLWQERESSGVLNALQYTVAYSGTVKLRNGLFIDLASDESIESSLQVLSRVSYDTIIAVKDLQGRTENTILCRDFDGERVFLDLLFSVSRHAYESIRRKSIALITLCLNAYHTHGLDPYTGLVGGFMKSVARELPDSTCRIIHTDDGDLRQALRHVEAELGCSGYQGEISYLNGKRHAVNLIPVGEMARAQEPYLGSSSVVIATGGGRGVTAVLCEELLKRFGCTIVAVGRTAMSSAPDAILKMDEESFGRYEPQFYKEELEKDRTKKIVELRRQYQAYQAVNEINRTAKRLQMLPGHFEYHCLDINDDEAVERVVGAVYEKYGHLDMILHGAGIQVSKILTKKSIGDFRNIVATKISSLGHFYRASERHRGDVPVHFHVLTSAFSSMGNDGQPDYGAANEAMNRLASGMSGREQGAYWSSLAWLGWAGIGMTRGSEYAALAASRNLRGVTKEEGQKIFSALMSGPPTAPVNILLGDGEIEFYNVNIRSSQHAVATNLIGTKEVDEAYVPKQMGDSHLTERVISLENAPFLNDHVVNGVATVPAAFLTALIADIARQMRPELKIVSFEDTHYHKFIRVREGRETKLRLDARVTSETGTGTAIQIHVYSDFVHKTGFVLQSDILHKQTVVRMSRALPTSVLMFDGPPQVDGMELPDPYLLERATVQLKGQFDSMTNIRVGTNHRRADYQLRRSDKSEFKYGRLIPNMVMVDSFWRFGAIHATAHNTLPLYVPEECAKMSIYFDFADFDSSSLKQRLIFSGENPRAEGDLLRLGRIHAWDHAGNIMLMVEGAICRRFGEVKHALAG